LKNQTRELVRLALSERRQEMLAAWMGSQRQSIRRPDIELDESTMQRQCQEFLEILSEAIGAGAPFESLEHESWSAAKRMLRDMSRLRVHSGFDWAENASFLMSLKRPLFTQLSADVDATHAHVETVWRVSALLDELGLYMAAVYLETRESVIEQQREDLLELSSPVVELWEGILVLPLIGTLDSRRAQEVMTALLEAIERTRNSVVILDITGVSAVDTQVAQHLLNTVAAARLMGAKCVLSGVGPQIAQTIVHLGIDFSTLDTRATMAGALQYGLQQVGKRVVSVREPAA
jgi:rsbT co-antagonist protein RsbR